MAFDDSELSFKNTVLLVKDVAVSKKFYTDIMIQEIEMDVGKNVGFKGGLAIWEREYARNFINSSVNRDENKFQPKNPRKNSSIELYFEFARLDEIYGKIIKSGMEIAHEIITQPWQQRAFRFFDPDGYLIEIAEPMWAVVIRLHDGGLSSKEIQKQTMMPLEIVKLIIKTNFGMG